MITGFAIDEAEVIRGTARLPRQAPGRNGTGNDSKNTTEKNGKG